MPAQRRKILVNIFQRGGMDGLLAVQPYTDPGLAMLRPKSKLPAPGSNEENALLELDGVFGLHPALAPLHPFYRDGRMAIVHGVGSPEKTRSHFDQQEYMETGTPGEKGTRTGWLNRAMAQMDPEGATPFRAVALTPALPLALYGDEAALAIPELSGFGLRVEGDAEAIRVDLAELYRDAPTAHLAGVGAESFAAMALLADDAEGAAQTPGVDYPEHCSLGVSLRQIASLIKRDLGLAVAWAEYAPADWDMHTNHAGMFNWRAGLLAKSIAAFYADLGDLAEDVVVLTATEFGRTVAENGSSGTDHGRGTCFFLLGSNVAGGKVYGTVPPMNPAYLEDERDLPVTTDFREVFAEVAARQLGAADAAALFPGWTGSPMPLFRTA